MENTRAILQAIKTVEIGEPYLAMLIAPQSSDALKPYEGTWLRPYTAGTNETNLIVAELEKHKPSTQLEMLTGALAVSGVHVPSNVKVATEEKWTELLALAMAGYATLVYRRR